jgi:hypothetical protein
MSEIGRNYTMILDRKLKKMQFLMKFRFCAPNYKSPQS